MLKDLLERLKPFLAYPNPTLSKMENDEKKYNRMLYSTSCKNI
jgi:hypothetical protein